MQPLLVLIVSVDVAVPQAVSVTGLGLKLATVLAGLPVSLKLTLPAKPFTEVSVTV